MNKGKTGGKRKNANDPLTDYLSGKSDRYKRTVSKELMKKYTYTGGATQKEAIEKAVAGEDGYSIKKTRTPNDALLFSAAGGKYTQYDYLVSTGNDEGIESASDWLYSFSSSYENPVQHYFKTGDRSRLPKNLYKDTYIIHAPTGQRGRAEKISENYIKYLMKQQTKNN